MLRLVTISLDISSFLKTYKMLIGHLEGRKIPNKVFHFPINSPLQAMVLSLSKNINNVVSYVMLYTFIIFSAVI